MTHGSPLAFSLTQSHDPHIICILCVDKQVNVIMAIRRSEIQSQGRILNLIISYNGSLQNTRLDAYPLIHLNVCYVLMLSGEKIVIKLHRHMELFIKRKH